MIFLLPMAKVNFRKLNKDLNAVVNVIDRKLLRMKKKGREGYRLIANLIIRTIR